MGKNFVFFIILIIFIFSILHFLGWKGFYYTTIWYDKLLHFLAGMTIVIIGWRLLGTRSLFQKILISFLFLLIIAILWEGFEFCIDKVFNLASLQLGLNDTLWDLIFDILGGIVILILFQIRNMVKSK